MANMKTPIYDFVMAYANSDKRRLHMPGHKGNGSLGFEKYDITEISGADALFVADGIIAESEKNLTEIYETRASLYSCEGSSLAVRAMLYLAMLHAKEAREGKGDCRDFVLAGRNAHSSFMTALALLNLDVKWLYPSREQSYLSCQITPEYLEKCLDVCEKKPICVYITSPDYLGRLSDISALSSVCKRHGVLLVVDNAHGAYLKFLENDAHPISQGADMCCDSAHKTLECLTGGAYLHISKNAPRSLVKNAKGAMSVFASTSPSYLILSSLDKLNEYLATEVRSDLRDTLLRLSEIRSRLRQAGYTLCEQEELKITVKATDYGYFGYEIGKILEENDIIPELADTEYVVLMAGIRARKNDLDALCEVLLNIPKREKKATPVLDFDIPKPLLTPRQALLSPRERVSVCDAVGRIFVGFTLPCPPAVAIAVAGEQITGEIAETLAYYGHKTVEVAII